MSIKPLAITMGDSSGVGPEIILKRYHAGLLPADVIVYGDIAILQHGRVLLGLEDCELHVCTKAMDLRSNALNLRDFGMLTRDDFTPGVLNSKSGRAAYEYVVQATRDALDAHIRAVVTLPMNKEATQRSVPGFTGHTELIARLTDTTNFSMMLGTEDVAVSHVSTHVSLQEAITLVNPPRVLNVIKLTHETLSRFMTNPRIAVCGLNPHASENGMFGKEEEEHINPAIAQARAENIDASGPYPADTVFYQAIHNDRFDAIICMYHDQGHAPMKLHAFESAVNVTIGLPIVRTSVDHGTAFDIAWQSKAFTGSLQHAIDYAKKLSN